MCTVQRDVYVFKFCSSSSYSIFTVWLLHCIHLEYAVKPNLEQHSYLCKLHCVCVMIVQIFNSYWQRCRRACSRSRSWCDLGTSNPNSLNTHDSSAAACGHRATFHQHPARESISRTITMMNSIHLYLLFHFVTCPIR